MSVSSERLVNALGKLVSTPEVVELLKDLDLGSAPAIKDGVSSDLEATKHGVALFFRTAHHLREVDGLGALPPSTSILSDIKFSQFGYSGGAGYSGALPRGLAFSDVREAVRERLGPPTKINRIVATDLWDFGDQYMSVGFARDGSTILELACGLNWKL